MSTYKQNNLVSMYFKIIFLYFLVKCYYFNISLVDNSRTKSYIQDFINNKYI